jgi:hypothetical protein
MKERAKKHIQKYEKNNMNDLERNLIFIEAGSESEFAIFVTFHIV